LGSWICDAVLNLFKVRYPLKAGWTCRLAVQKRRQKMGNSISRNLRGQDWDFPLWTQQDTNKATKSMCWQDDASEHSPDNGSTEFSVVMRHVWDIMESVQW
jgi:hypothetical protein